MNKFLVLAALLLPLQGWSQNVYKLKYHVDVPVTAIGLGTFTTSYFLGKKAEGPSVQQIQILDKGDIWRIDRSAANRWSPKCAQVSDVLLYSSIAMPTLLLLNKNARKEKMLLPMYAQSMILSVGVTCLVKELATRYRPFVYNESANDDMKTSKDAKMSFFSGHTSLAATGCFFTAKVFSDLNPNSPWKPVVWTGAFVLPAAVGALRYCAGRHYPTDILVGYVTGAAIGYLVPYLHKKRVERITPEYTIY